MIDLVLILIAFFASIATISAIIGVKKGDKDYINFSVVIIIISVVLIFIVGGKL